MAGSGLGLVDTRPAQAHNRGGGLVAGHPVVGDEAEGGGGGGHGLSIVSFADAHYGRDPWRYAYGATERATSHGAASPLLHRDGNQ